MTAPAADGRGGTPPRPAVPAAREERPQWFGLWVFDIQEAMQVLRAAPRPPQPLPVTLWAQAYGLIPAPGTSPRSIPLLGPGPGFDRDYAMTTDLAKPVIIAAVPVPDGGPPAPLLIDGTHRLYKATVQGHTHLPAWSLTQAETLAIRHRLGARPPAARRRLSPGRESRP